MDNVVSKPNLKVFLPLVYASQNLHPDVQKKKNESKFNNRNLHQ